MIIKNDTILLRAIEMEDMDFCREMINSSYIEGLTMNKSMPVSKEAQKEWFFGRHDNEIRFIVEENLEPVGMVSLTNINWINRTAESGIKMHEKRIKKRETTINAANAFLCYAFCELNLNCIYANTLEYNYLSRKLLQKIGFVKEGVLRARVYKNGKYNNVITYSLLKDEYFKSEMYLEDEGNE